MSEMTLTPLDVQRIFDYDAVTGALIWREKISHKTRLGTSAGSMNGLHQIKINGQRYTRGRLVWAWHRGEWPQHYICHLNHDSLDDRIENLVDVDWRERRQMQRRPVRASALPEGVAHARHGHNYSARLDRVHLGSFKTPEQAHEAYKAAHVAKYGDLSRYTREGGI